MTRRFIVPALALAGLATTGLAAPALGSAPAKFAKPMHGDWTGTVKGTHGRASISFIVDKTGKRVKKLYAGVVFPLHCYWGDGVNTAYVRKTSVNHSGKFSVASSSTNLQKGVSAHLTGHFTAAKKMTGTFKVSDPHHAHCQAAYTYTAKHQKKLTGPVGVS
jgi:hypothetical protein